MWLILQSRISFSQLLQVTLGLQACPLSSVIEEHPSVIHLAAEETKHLTSAGASAFLIAEDHFLKQLSGFIRSYMDSLHKQVQYLFEEMLNLFFLSMGLASFGREVLFGKRNEVA